MNNANDDRNPTAMDDTHPSPRQLLLPSSSPSVSPCTSSCRHLRSSDSTLMTTASSSAGETSSTGNPSTTTTTTDDEDPVVATTAAMDNEKVNADTTATTTTMILDCHAVLGDRNARRDTRHSTTATQILRQVKHDMKRRYAGRPLSVWYEAAVQEYHQRIQQAFGNTASATDQPGLILIKCTKEALTSKRVETPHAHVLPGSKSAGIAKLPEALEFYFKSRDAVTLEARVAYCQGQLRTLRQQSSSKQSNPQLKALYDEFDDLLDFCNRKMEQVAQGSKLAEKLLHKLHLLPALKEQWELLLQERRLILEEATSTTTTNNKTNPQSKQHKDDNPTKRSGNALEKKADCLVDLAEMEQQETFCSSSSRKDSIDAVAPCATCGSDDEVVAAPNIVDAGHENEQAEDLGFPVDDLNTFLLDCGFVEPKEDDKDKEGPHQYAGKDFRATTHAVQGSEVAAPYDLQDLPLDDKDTSRSHHDIASTIRELPRFQICDFSCRKVSNHDKEAAAPPTPTPTPNKGARPSHRNSWDSTTLLTKDKRPTHRRSASLPIETPQEVPLNADWPTLPNDEEDLSPLFSLMQAEDPLFSSREQRDLDTAIETLPLKEKSPVVGHRRSSSLPPPLPLPSATTTVVNTTNRRRAKTMLEVPTKAMPYFYHKQPRSRSSSDGGGGPLLETGSIGSNTSSGKKRSRRKRGKKLLGNRRRTFSDSSKRSRHDDSTATSSYDVPLEIETRSSDEEKGSQKVKYDDDDCVDSYGSGDSSESKINSSRQPVRLAVGDGQSGLYTGTQCHQSGLPHGKGKLLYEKDQTVYQGEWCQGLWHGDGYYRDRNRGYMYKGEFFRHNKHGVGAEFFADGTVLHGMFCYGCIVSGEMKYPDGSAYSGDWNNSGVPHGQGTFITVDGGVYNGTYRNGERSQGTFQYPDGTVYSGEWSQGRPNGQGETKFPTGITYKGGHKGGLFQGKGKMVWPDGAWYQGEFHDGERTGFGKQFNAKGSLIHEGPFHEGEPAEELLGPVDARTMQW